VSITFSLHTVATIHLSRQTHLNTITTDYSYSTQFQIQIEDTLLLRKEEVYFESNWIQLNRGAAWIIFLGKYRNDNMTGSLMPVITTAHPSVPSLKGNSHSQVDRESTNKKKLETTTFKTEHSWNKDKLIQ
jgi:hypothetical protein